MVRRGAAKAGLAACCIAALCVGPASAEVVLRPDIALAGVDATAASVRLGVGQTLRIELPSQPGTGYSWEARPVDAAILAPAEVDCPARPAEGRVGAIEPDCFGLTAVAAGEALAVFVYRRHWETRPDGLLRYELTVAVAP